MKKAFGSLLIVLVVALHVWLWFGAHTVGAGLGLRVVVLSWKVPAVFLLITGFSIFVFGAVIGWGRDAKQTT